MSGTSNYASLLEHERRCEEFKAATASASARMPGTINCGPLSEQEKRHEEFRAYIDTKLPYWGHVDSVPPGPWDWCKSNVEKRVESWNVLVTVIGLLAAFVIDALLNIDPDSWPEDNRGSMMVHAVSLSASLLVVATLLLSATIWTVTRRLAEDEPIFSKKDWCPEVLANFQAGYGAWREVKLLTENSRLPLRVNVLHVVSWCFLLGTFSYFVGIASRMIAVFEQATIAIPCVGILSFSILFAVGMVAKIGIYLG